MKLIKRSQQYESAVDKAVEYYNNKKYKQSLLKFQELAEFNFENLKVHEMLSRNYIMLNNINKAEKEYDIYVELVKKKNIFLKVKSFNDIIKKLDDPEKIKKKYDRLLKRKKLPTIEETGTAIELGFIYLSQKKYKKAEKMLLEFKDKFIQNN